MGSVLVPSPCFFLVLAALREEGPVDFQNLLLRQGLALGERGWRIMAAFS